MSVTKLHQIEKPTNRQDLTGTLGIWFLLKHFPKSVKRFLEIVNAPKISVFKGLK